MKISYNWLKWYVPELPPAEKLWDVFTFHLCEVESMDKTEDGDTIFDINILPNRAHDLLSHQGVAQELSALLDIEYKSPVEMYKIPPLRPHSAEAPRGKQGSAGQAQLQVTIESPLCRRYMGRIVRNVKVGPSPDWVVKHLESIGQKSINNVVDATNIVMFDCGNPTHVFDAKKIKDLRLKIKEPGASQSISLLGGEVKELQETDLVISDGEDAVLAIAGVKGGTNAEVTSETTDIILEVANFDPVSTRRTGRRLSLFTDALKRFENDLSPVRAEYAMRELSATILEMCPDAVFEEIVDVFPDRDAWNTSNKIGISVTDINNNLGTSFSADEIESVWKRMKFDYTRDGDDFVIFVPLLRFDLLGRHDLVEEVGRVLGYDRVDAKLPHIPFTPRVNETMYRVLAARKKLAEDGYREVMTYSLVKKGPVEIARAPKGKEAMRSNLSDGLKSAFELNRLNAPYLEQSEIKVFEIGDVYPESGVEVTHVAWADKKGIQEMSLEEFTKEIVLGDLYDSVLPPTSNLQPLTFAPWSTFPFIYRDISVWVPEGVESATVLQVIQENAGEFVVKGPTLIDSFTKDGRTSYAFRLVFQSSDRTLTDADILPHIENITQALIERGIEIR